MLRLRGTFSGEYSSFDLVASLIRLQQHLAAHLDQHYPGEHVTVTVTLHPEVRGRASRRHEEYVFAPIWDSRAWLVWETPQEAPHEDDSTHEATIHPEHEENHDARTHLPLRPRP